MSWKITEKGQVDEPSALRLGNKFLIANGYLGYRGTLEEDTLEQKVAVIVSGLYDRVGQLWREPVNLPNGCYFQIYDRGQPLKARSSRVIEHAQTLDMQFGIHERHTIFETQDGNLIHLYAERFASLTSPHLICIRYIVKTSRDIELVVQTGIDGDVWDINGPHLEDLQPEVQNQVTSLSARTHENRIPVVVAEWTEAGKADLSIQQNKKQILRRIILPARAGEECLVTRFIAHYTGLDHENPLLAARALCRSSAQAGFEKIQREHKSLWKERWKNCDVTIDGDEAAQLALRFSLYHLLAIAPTHAENVSIPARGLSGQVYKGAIFWDTEIFMLPFFQHTNPSMARHLLLYRFHTLDGARRKAAEYGYRGAFYAWESQETGDDACSLFNVTDVFTNRPMRTYFRDKQVHISADIVYAFWKYYLVTGDDSIFLDGGAEVIFECARFFLSCIYYSKDRGRYEILDVTGPDEYHERVNNNFFTNLMVTHTFDVCLRLEQHLRSHYPAQVKTLVQKLDFQQDLESIREIAGAVYLPRPNKNEPIIPQFDGYLKLEDILLEELSERKLDPNEYLGGGNGLAVSTQIIKQADVILALYLFNDRYSQEIKAANWAYYEPRCEHGSTLSACSYSLIAAQIGNIDWAYQYFIKTASIDLSGESKQYAGTIYIGGTHPAASGGAWMSIVFGLCGICCQDKALSIRPRLPAGWREVNLPITVRGQKLRITLAHEQVTVQALAPLSDHVMVEINQQYYRLSDCEPVTISLSNGKTA